MSCKVLKVLGVSKQGKWVKIHRKNFILNMKEYVIATKWTVEVGLVNIYVN